MTISYLKREGKPDLAYIYNEGKGPLVMFCGGYRSDMNGTKATYLEEQCRGRSQAYVRFDYSGHGASHGCFEEGRIGGWADDMLAVFDHIAPEKAVVVGSSMGGWMALLLAEKRSRQLQGLIGIAAAPDFTEDLFARLSDEQKAALARNGFVKVPNEYSDEPYHYSMAFYEESKAHYLLNAPRHLSCPTLLFQGLEDNVVLPTHAQHIADHYGGDIKVIYVEGGDHSLSRPEDLVRLDKAVQNLSA